MRAARLGLGDLRRSRLPDRDLLRRLGDRERDFLFDFLSRDSCSLSASSLSYDGKDGRGKRNADLQTVLDL